MSPSERVTVPPATVLPRLLSRAGGAGIERHMDRWGRMPGGGAGLIAEIERSGLRGRGGAAFPTAVKMRSVLGRRQVILVANGAEREPASLKDKVLLGHSPHLVLDGISVAAESIGATEAILCVDRAAADSLAAVARALTERARLGADRVPIRVEATPGAFVTGEESALVHWLNGGPAKPTFVPPRPYEKGVRGRPTLVNNVETLAHVGMIARFGAEWFRSVGTGRDPGSALVTVIGDIGQPGVYEIPYGLGLGSLVGQAGPRTTPQALLVGGYSGAWVSYRGADGVGFDSASLAQVKASPGCGAVCVLGAESCGLLETAAVLRWMAGQSAGQCGPCVHGLPALSQAFDGVVAGDRRGSALRRVSDLLGIISGRGACHHPDGVVKMVHSALTVFARDIEDHRRRGPCRVRSGLLPLPPGDPVWR